MITVIFIFFIVQFFCNNWLKNITFKWFWLSLLSLQFWWFLLCLPTLGFFDIEFCTVTSSCWIFPFFDASFNDGPIVTKMRFVKYIKIVLVCNKIVLVCNKVVSQGQCQQNLPNGITSLRTLTIFTAKKDQKPCSLMNAKTIFTFLTFAFSITILEKQSFLKDPNILFSYWIPKRVYSVRKRTWNGVITTPLTEIL